MDLLDNKAQSVGITFKDASNPWDLAHSHLNQSSIKGFFEPDIESKLYEPEIAELKLKGSESGYLQSWPQPRELQDNLVWYLNDNFSQLKKAKEEVISKVAIENREIKIAIIDTGYQEGHPALPKFLDEGRSFIKGEENQPAIDKKAGSIAEQEGHGTATASILAGKEVDLNIYSQTYKGEFGGIPFAKVIPIRICETVALVRTRAFVDAVNYAIQEGCEVISMSMAGLPTKAWATVVNKAYENGVVLVTAAGNSWYKGVGSISPKRLLYPARWDRVIAATGVTYNQLPYVMDAQIKEKGGSSEYMQGNYGPKRAMENAIAAYTPNTTWATLNDKKNPYRINGGGTSSATPQIAAAAALWIVRYRKEINEILNSKPQDKWLKVELVKNALFSSADKSYEHSNKYFGQGRLKAYDALITVPNPSELKKAREAKVMFRGILDALGILFRVKSMDIDKENERSEMYGLEILQEIHNNPKLYHLLNYDEDEMWSDEDKQAVKDEILKSINASNALKALLTT